MNIKYLVFLLAILSPLTYSQEKGTSNADLRGGRTLFSISLNEKELKGYELLRSSSGDHSLESHYEDKVEVKKISSSYALKLDEEISAEFINLKYFMGSLKKCSEFYLFKMRGEELEICLNDKKRKIKIDELIKKIRKKV